MTSRACIYCDGIGAITVSGDHVCGDHVCRAKYMLNPSNDAVVRNYRNNPMEFEFLIQVSFAAAQSTRRDMIFNPFPWCFKTRDEFTDDPLGIVATNRNYAALTKCVKLMSIDGLLATIEECDTDQILIDELCKLDLCGKNLYKFLKFIVETKAISSEYREWVVDIKTRKSYRQFKIKHDSYTESEFMKSSQDFCYLFHGSAIENWHSIIRNGIFNASGTKMMTTGAAYGNGVYLSDNLAVNSSYSRGSLSGGSHTGCDMVVAVFQVAAAKSKYQKSTNIFVVPDSKLLLLRYLIVMPRGCDLTAISSILEKEFARTHEVELRAELKTNHRINRRITVDIAKFRDIPDYISCEYDPVSNLCNLYIDRDVSAIAFVIKFTPQYPFEPPIICIEHPIVKSASVTDLGVVSMKQLLINEWTPAQKLNGIIQTVMSSIVTVNCDATSYDLDSAFREALLLRK